MQTTSKSATEAWIKQVINLRDNGQTVGPRGLHTREIVGCQLVVDMNRPIVCFPGRKINYKFMAAEALFIVSGDNRVCNLAKYNERMAEYSDNGHIFNGAYGPAFNSQAEYAIRQLVQDLNTRQSVISIWQENPRESKDKRCTLSLQFLVRDGKINTIVTMRSSDIVWGFAYDVFNFTMMTLDILTKLNSARKDSLPIGLGDLILNAGSSHIYENFYEEAIEWIMTYQEVREDDRALFNRYADCYLPSQVITDWKFVTDALHHAAEGLRFDPWIISPSLK